MDDSVRYCTECGKELSPIDRFCPACGANVDDMAKGTAAPASQTGIGYQLDPRTGYQSSEATKSLSYAMLLWGIIGTLYGLYSVFTADSAAENMVQAFIDADMWKTLVDMGYSEDLIRTSILAIGGCITVSGLSALVAGHFTYRGENYKLAITACVISTIFAATGLVTLIVGIFVSYRLSKCKYLFKS